jgi:hypothetical protein
MRNSKIGSGSGSGQMQLSATAGPRVVTNSAGRYITSLSGRSAPTIPVTCLQPSFQDRISASCSIKHNASRNGFENVASRLKSRSLGVSYCFFRRGKHGV